MHQLYAIRFNQLLGATSLAIKAIFLPPNAIL